MQGAQIALPPITKLNKKILIVIGAIFVLDLISVTLFKISLSRVLSLSVATPYALLTYPAVAGGFMELIFNGLLFWMLGGDIEYRLGRAGYLKFLGGISLFTGLLFLGFAFTFSLSGAVSGLSVISCSLILLYGLLNPNQSFSFMLLIPVQAKYFIWILIAVELYSGVMAPGATNAIASLISMGLAYLFYLHKFKGGLKIPSKKAKKGHLRVVTEDDDESGPRYYQ